MFTSHGERLSHRLPAEPAQDPRRLSPKRGIPRNEMGLTHQGGCMRSWSVLTLVLALIVVGAVEAAINPPIVLRGDANGDGRVNISDPIFINNWLFSGGTRPGCIEAADANDDGAVNSADSTYLYNFLFQGGSPPPAPFPSCAPTTWEWLECYAPSCH